MRADVTVRARRDLDERFAQADAMREALRLPAGGWIRTIRHGLAMTLVDLGQRMGIKHSAVIKLERREIEGDITLRKMRKIATALDCEFVYGFLPKDTFESTVRRRALTVARLSEERADEIGIAVVLRRPGLWRKRPEERRSA